MRKFLDTVIERVAFPTKKKENGSRRTHIASLFSLGFAALLFSPWILWTGANAQRISIALQWQAQEIALEKQAAAYREIICLTNVVYHEARGESRTARDDIALVVLASVKDRSFTKARNVCEYAHIKGKFSNIRSVEQVRADLPEWPKLYDEVTRVYNGPRTLPNGWGCVRAFRLSDDKLETLKDKVFHQLGITSSAKGLKYHAEAFVPIDTIADVTFYSPRGGCKYPSPTNL